MNINIIQVNTYTIQQISRPMQPNQALNQIQLFQLQPALNKAKSYQNQLSLDSQQISQEVILRIESILNNFNMTNRNNRKPLKFYSLFYVNPLSKVTGMWDFLIIVIIYVFLLQISLALGYGPSFIDGHLTRYVFQTLYIIFMIVLGVDVVINFHKGYYAFGRGKVIDDPQLIIKHYLKIYFTMDIVSLGLMFVPIFKTGYYVNFLQIVPAVLLYIKKFKCQNQIVGMLQYQKKLRIFFVLFMLAADVLMIGHFGACIFVGIDLLLWREQYYGDNPSYYWLSNNDMYSINLMDGPWIAQYVYAQSFSTGTLSTIAPGPFPKNPIQILYSNLVMIFFMFLASYVAQIIVSILLSEDQIRTFHEQNIQKFDKFLKLKGVAQKISSRVHNFFELIWEKQVKMNIDQQREILDKLPISLKQELIIQMQFVQRLRLFKNFSQSSLLVKLISLKVDDCIIDVGTHLFKSETSPNQYYNQYLYYFKEGFAKFYVNFNDTQLVLALSNVQKIAGQFQLITKLAYSYSCKSLDLCVISRISGMDIVSAMQQNGMLQQYQQLKYRLLIENKLYLINKICIVCEDEHIQMRCPHLNPSIQVREHYFNLVKMARKNNRKNNYRRSNIKSQKRHKIDKQAIARAYIILIFLVYRHANKKIKHEDRLQKANNFQLYFKQFNVEGATNFY